MFALVGKKIGMTQVFDNAGNIIPVSVIKIEDNVVVSKKDTEKHGYSSVVLATSKAKEKDLKKPVVGQFKKQENLPLMRKIFEVRDFDLECKPSDVFTVSSFSDSIFVDVTGISKGKGTQGVIKRWGYDGGPETHGSKFHRVAGSTGQCAQPARTIKGLKMPGRMGNEQKSVQNLKLVKIDEENGLLVVKGAVPGNKGEYLLIKKSIKK